MCGIAGIASKRNFDTHLINKMSSLMTHRGPDNTSFYVDDQVAFGHNRLALVDLTEHGNQPFENDDYVLVFNGEIYNFKEIKTDLIASYTIDFKSTCDTEVLFYSLINFGIAKTLNIVKGMFAFAFYDKKSGKITIARDRVGIKPLFYSLKDNKLCFASELKALVIGLGFNEVSPNYLLEAPFGLYEYSRKITAFTHILQMEPGTLLEYDINSHSSEVKTYFKIADLVDENQFKELNKLSSDAVSEKFDHLFSSAVHSMILADAPMGSFVSGGLDSALISAVAFKFRTLNLYTANISGIYSEFKEAKILADTLKTNLFDYKFEPAMFLRDWVKTTWFYESPIVVHTNSVPFQNVSKIAFDKKDKAVVTGEGADELFLGYPRLLTKKYDSLINLPIDVVTKIYKKIPGLTRYLNLNKTDFQNDILTQTRNFESELFDQGYKERYQFIKDKDELEYQLMTPRMIDKSLHSLLWRNDRMGMMHSIESRFPFLDEGVLEFGMNLPVKYKIGTTSKFYNWKHPFKMDKAVVRKLGEKYLPKEIAHKKKQGFPMYGHMFVDIKKEFFLGGFWQNYWNMNAAGVAYMVEKSDPYLIAKIASVEIWGSLFSVGQTIEQVQQRVDATMKMRIVD